MLNKSTFLVGDSFDYLRKANYTKASLKSLIADSVKTHNDLKKLPAKELKDPSFLYERNGNNYIEGHLWVPWKVDGDKIVEDKSLTKVSDYRRLP